MVDMGDDGKIAKEFSVILKHGSILTMNEPHSKIVLGKAIFWVVEMIQKKLYLILIRFTIS